MTDQINETRNCQKCIHLGVCKIAEACDGCVYGCKHFKEEKHGRWIPTSGSRMWNCSECKTIGSPRWKVCPMCEAIMDGGKEDG